MALRPFARTDGRHGQRQCLRLCIAALLLLAVSLIVCVVTRTRAIWRELRMDTVDTLGITSGRLTAGPLQLCLRNRVDPAVSDPATNSFEYLDGALCYPLRTAPARLPLLNENVSVKLEFRSVDICDRRKTERIPSDVTTQFPLPEMLLAMSVPRVHLQDAVELVDFACSATALTLHGGVLAAVACALIALMVALSQQSPTLRKYLEQAVALLTLSSAIALTVELVLWQTRTTSRGEAGTAMYLGIGVVVALVSSAALLYFARRFEKEEELNEAATTEALI